MKITIECENDIEVANITRAGGESTRTWTGLPAVAFAYRQMTEHGIVDDSYFSVMEHPMSAGLVGTLHKLGTQLVLASMRQQEQENGPRIIRAAPLNGTGRITGI